MRSEGGTLGCSPGGAGQVVSVPLGTRGLRQRDVLRAPGTRAWQAGPRAGGRGLSDGWGRWRMRVGSSRQWGRRGKGHLQRGGGGGGAAEEGDAAPTALAVPIPPRRGCLGTLRSLPVPYGRAGKSKRGESHRAQPSWGPNPLLGRGAVLGTPTAALPPCARSPGGQRVGVSGEDAPNAGSQDDGEDDAAYHDHDLLLRGERGAVRQSRGQQGAWGGGTRDRGQGQGLGRCELVLCSTGMRLRPLGTGSQARREGMHPRRCDLPKTMGEEGLAWGCPQLRAPPVTSPPRGAASLQHPKTGASPRPWVLSQSPQPGRDATATVSRARATLSPGAAPSALGASLGCQHPACPPQRPGIALRTERRGVGRAGIVYCHGN